MIVYSGRISDFSLDVDKGVIAKKVQTNLRRLGFNHNNESEFRSWDNSLMYMKNVLSTSEIPQDLHVAIEYQIPSTSKRVDFLITGLDGYGESKVVIVELKQWEKASKTDKEDLVQTFIGGGQRLVTHPSYQAYSYAKTIENYNSYVENNNISMIPCSYLHNYKEEYRSELEDDIYQSILKESPIFLKEDTLKLREFISSHLKKSDQGKALYEIDHGKIRPSKSLQDSLSSMLEGNKEFYMLDEQKVAFSLIKDIVERSVEKDEKSTIIIEGGPGTGKSVIAINLLVEFKNLVSSYVTKNVAPREVYFSKLRQENYKLNYLKNLFKGSGQFIETQSNVYDLLIVDEAHRLNEKTGFFNKGENQIQEIINASKVSIFFIDENQRIHVKDFGTISEIKKQALKLNSKIYSGEDFILTSQYRCNGSESYIAFLEDLLGMNHLESYDHLELDYDIRYFDSPLEMKKELRALNKNNKSRMLAGYTYDWETKSNPNEDSYDIVFGDGFKAKWNFSNTKTWAIDEGSFDQVGCIHTSQGLEFEYVGVIIGKDLLYRNGEVVTDFEARAKTDRSLWGVKTHKLYDEADEIIRNTYKTLLTRGQKGCFIYCEDRELGEYVKRKIDEIKSVKILA